MKHIEAPILGDRPFGIYLKGDSTKYWGIRNAFNVSQAAWRSCCETPEAMTNCELRAENAKAWMALSRSCEECLVQTSKDLEIMSWFVVAQLHGDQPLSKVVEAMEVFVSLVENSIHEMQPVPPLAMLKGSTDEEREAETAGLKLRTFTQLFGEEAKSGLFYGPIVNLPLLAAITYGRVLLFERTGGLGALRAEAARANEEQTKALYQGIMSLQKLKELIARLDASVSRYAISFGLKPPPVNRGTQLVSDVIRVCRILTDSLGLVRSCENQVNETNESVMLIQKSKGKSEHVNIDVNSRREALTRIAQCAAFFRSTEPHSPIHLLLDRAVRWGELNATELYREILIDGSPAMSRMILMTGLESQGISDDFGPTQASPSAADKHLSYDNYEPVPVTLSKSSKRDHTTSNVSKKTDEIGSQLGPDPYLQIEKFQW